MTSANIAFCCSGCEAVYQLLTENHLEKYYEVAGARQVAAPNPVEPAPLLFIEEAARAWPLQGLCTLNVDLQGLRCAACVWLLEELFRRQGGTRIVINSALGKAQLVFERQRFSPHAWAAEIARYGYLVGEPNKASENAEKYLLRRLGVCAALSINGMIFSLAFYFGLDSRDSEPFLLFTWLNAALSTVVVFYGGWPFFQSAFLSLRRGLLHLDVPIALGMGLVFITSWVQLVRARGDIVYLDTLNVFVTLMLTGRWLQQRVLSANRNALLQSPEVLSLKVRRLRDGRVDVVAAQDIAVGDELVLSPREVVPLASQLVTDTATVNHAWMTGESHPSAVQRGDLITAGAVVDGQIAIRVRAQETMRTSALQTLLTQKSHAAPRSPNEGDAFWATLARRWVWAVLGVVAAGFLIWLPRGILPAVDVAAALLVVTCPCGIGIAIPLGQELIHLKLLQQGLFQTSADFLSRLRQVRALVFDKTGTLTLGRLQLKGEQPLAALSPLARSVLYTLASHSTHAVGRVIAQALLDTGGAQVLDGVEVREFPGQGVQLTWRHTLYQLGKPSWAATAQHTAAGQTVFSVNGIALWQGGIEEVLRSDAMATLLRLERETGWPVHILSGDEGARVTALAGRLGVPAQRAIGDLSPEQKRERVQAIADGKVLYLGDGVNDALAMGAAWCAGTPNTERPMLAQATDFYLGTPHLMPLAQAVRFAQLQWTMRRRIQAMSIAYNVLAITACLCGLMTPLRAAVFMPLSSLTMVATAVLMVNGSRWQLARFNPPRPAWSQA